MLSYNYILRTQVSIKYGRLYSMIMSKQPIWSLLVKNEIYAKKYSIV